MYWFAILKLSVALCFTFHATIRAQSGIQIKSGALHSLAVTAPGELFVWGHNGDGQLGLGDLRLRPVPTRVALKTPIKSIFARRDHTCAIFEGNQVKCWGENHSFQSGLPQLLGVVGDTPVETIEKLSAVDLGAGRPVKAILGNNHSCVLFDDGRLKCFGYNGSGELGIGKKQTILGAKAEEMGEALIAASVGGRVQDGCAGNGFTCVLLSGQRVKCFGSYISSGNETKFDVGFDAGRKLKVRYRYCLEGEKLVRRLCRSGEAHSEHFGRYSCTGPAESVSFSGLLKQYYGHDPRIEARAMERRIEELGVSQKITSVLGEASRSSKKEFERFLAAQADELSSLKDDYRSLTESPLAGFLKALIDPKTHVFLSESSLGADARYVKSLANHFLATRLREPTPCREEGPDFESTQDGCLHRSQNVVFSAPAGGISLLDLGHWSREAALAKQLFFCNFLSTQYSSLVF